MTCETFFWSLAADTTDGNYDFGGEVGLRDALNSGIGFRDFNLEQQGENAMTFYIRFKNGKDTGAWHPFIDELRTP